MKQKIFVLVMTLLICLSTVLIFPSDLEVEASGGGGGGEEEDDIGLDFNFLWDVTKTLSDAVYKAYPGLKITRGREMGTLGENWSAQRIWEFMKYNCSLKNVEPLSLGPITECPDRFYTSKINVTDYLLHIDIDSEDYDHDIPVNESFVIPMVRPKVRPFGNLTFNFTLPDEDNIVIWLEPSIKNWPYAGTFTNYSCINLSIDPTNEFDILIGNATYIEISDLSSRNKIVLL